MVSLINREIQKEKVLNSYGECIRVVCDNYFNSLGTEKCFYFFFLNCWFNF